MSDIRAASSGTATPPRLRVVFLDHVAQLSGGEIALLRVLPCLAESIDVRVVLGEEGPLVERLHEAGILVDVIPIPAAILQIRKADVRLRFLHPTVLLQLAQYILQVRDALIRLNADLVHTNSLKAAVYGGVAARLAGVPVVWHIRDHISSDYIPGGAVFFVRLMSRVTPTAIVTVSESSRRTLSRPPGTSSSHIFVVPDVVEPPSLPLQRRSASTTVGIVGRLAPWKGQHIFLEAFASGFAGTVLRARVIGSAMFGEDSYAESLRTQADRLGISKQVEFRGFRDSIWGELADLDVLVHSSLTPEPFGQVVLEGMAAGLPVVASRSGGPAEIITDGVDGLLTTPGDATELKDAMTLLCQDGALRRRLGAAARIRSRDFVPARAVRQLLLVYKGVSPKLTHAASRLSDAEVVTHSNRRGAI